MRISDWSSDVCSSDLVEEPTPEWLEKGDVRRFTPKQPDGTVRVIRTVRRDYGSVITRMYANGILDDDEFQACAWYRRMHEIAGMRGKDRKRVGSGKSVSVRVDLGGGRSSKKKK